MAERGKDRHKGVKPSGTAALDGIDDRKDRSIRYTAGHVDGVLRINRQGVGRRNSFRNVGKTFGVQVIGIGSDKGRDARAGCATLWQHASSRNIGFEYTG